VTKESTDYWKHVIEDCDHTLYQTRIFLIWLNGSEWREGFQQWTKYLGFSGSNASAQASRLYSVNLCQRVHDPWLQFCVGYFLVHIMHFFLKRVTHFQPCESTQTASSWRVLDERKWNSYRNSPTFIDFIWWRQLRT
jgi:hypothetical protein